ncbi:uncharacterized protein [Panulirus ornatus]|uniref:uncharacterized protein n=1 Tax=Panulirus ornatus TaxID=150431 RepID=UPI003A8B6B6E
MWAAPRSDIFIRFNLSRKGFPDTSELSICYRAKASTLAHIEPYISFAASKENVDSLVIMRIGSKVDVYVHDVGQPGLSDFHTDLVLHRWEHQCHVFSQGFYRAFVNGKERAKGPLINEDGLLPLNSTLCFGMEQDSVGGGFDKTQIFRGHMAQVNIWNRKISEKEVRDIASCKVYGEGNVFSSDFDVLEEVGTTLDTVPLLELCEPASDFFVLPMMFSIHEARRACYRMGYALYAPETPKKNQELYNISLQFLDTCTNTYHLWIGVSDELEEGVWHKDSDHTVLTDLSFQSGQPDGMVIQNCVYMSAFSGLWSDEACELGILSCASCTKRQYPPLRLRGLCFRTEAETSFEILGYINGRPYFHGYYGYMIYMFAPGSWVLFDTKTNETLATLTLKSVSDYPIGRKVWEVSNPLCDLPQNSEIAISLSPCHSSEFTCANGDCITKEQRCNSRDDCPDLSDENECFLVLRPESYRAERPPDPLVQGKPVELASMVQILRFTDINDIQRIVSAEINLAIIWKDTRLKYLNLKNTMEWNRLAEEETDGIWRPFLEFPNVQDGRVRLLKERLYLEKAGDPLPVEFNDIKMESVYSGESTSLVQVQHYSGTFACYFDVFYYPFDKQKCSILIQLSSVRQDNVTFYQEGTSVEYMGFEELPLFVVNNFAVEVTHRGDNQTRYSVLSVEFELSRRWTVIMMNLYFPTNMLLATGYATLFLNVADQGDRLTLSLTTLLVLYTLFNNSSASLPVTAYVKMIDMWFLYCISLLFFIIVCHVVVKMKVNQVYPVGSEPTGGLAKLLRQGSPERILKSVRVFVVPSFVIIFNSVYWAALLRSLSK